MDFFRFVVPAFYITLAGCATGGGIALTACLSDPPTKSMLCKKSPEGNEWDVPYEASGDMVCMPKGDYRYLLGRALK